MKKLALIAMSVVLALLPAAPGSAQNPTTPATQLNRVIGTVTSIDPEGKQLTVKTDGGPEVSVLLDEKTAFLRVAPGERDLSKAVKIAFTDLATGDRVLARGLPAQSVIVMTKTDLQKKQEQERAEWQRRGISGTIATLNPPSKEITVTVRGREGNTPVVVVASAGTVLRRYAPDSVRFADAKPSTFAELKVGDQLRALGNKSEDGKRFTAEEIVSGSFHNVAATVVSVDAASNELKVMDLETKKPLTITVNNDSTLRRLPPMVATMMAQRAQMLRAGPGAGAGPGAPPTGPGAGQFVGRPPGGPPSGPGGGPPPGPQGAMGGPSMGMRGMAGGPGGPGGQGGFDIQQMLDRMPALQISELKRGDALIVSSTKGTDPARLMAIIMLAGVEPLLTAASNGGQQMMLGTWNFEMGLP